jgi:hypothetical protein
MAIKKRSKFRASRNRNRERAVCAHVLDVIGKHYSDLRQRVWLKHPRTSTDDDIFHDTIIELSSDMSLDGKSDEYIITRFLYRYRMVAYQNIHDELLRKEMINHGIQSKTGEEKESAEEDN